MTAAERDTDAGVRVPRELCGVVARLAVLGLAELSRRDGGLSPAPGLAALLSELSARGRGRATVRVPLMAPLGSSEAAQMAGVSARSVRRLAAAGRLRARRQGRDWLIDPDAIEDCAERRRRGLQLDEARDTDVAVSTADVIQAEREAVEAGELLAELERAAVEAPPDKRPAATEVTEKRALAEIRSPAGHFHAGTRGAVPCSAAADRPRRTRR
ncbi:MAG: helix-turn-helix domain-containing protein [Streptosporangiaceae bacterium]